MNIAEYIEQNMRKNSRKFTVFYSKFAKHAGLKDIRTAQERIDSDLQELYTCRLIKHSGANTIQSCLIEELFFTDTGVVIDFSHWIYQLYTFNPHWLSDILQQTRMNNYIVRGI